MLNELEKEIKLKSRYCFIYTIASILLTLSLIFMLITNKMENLNFFIILTLLSIIMASIESSCIDTLKFIYLTKRGK